MLSAPALADWEEDLATAVALRPTHIVSWGLEDGDGTTPAEFRLNSRPVG